MKDSVHPLYPFLVSLVSDGICPTIQDYERISLILQTGDTWTIMRLRETLISLLIKNQEQQEIFLRRFNAFFTSKPDTENAYADIDVQSFLANLKQIEQKQEQIRKPETFKQIKPLRKPVKTHVDRIEEEEIEDKELDNKIVGAEKIEAEVLETKKNEVESKKTEDKNEEDKNEEPEEIHWNENSRRYFPLGSIGGKPAPLLNDDILSQIADSMGYFRSEQAGKILNMPASMQASLNKGGIPILEFYKRKQGRSLLILEDAFAEPLAWNPIAKELAKGMIQRGVPVLYGQFEGSPELFKTEDGSVYRLEDLEDQRLGYLLLIFTDGNVFYKHERKFVIESLSRWPAVAWMELREPRFWDENSEIPARHNIPIYPGTSNGIINAVKRFLTEQGTSVDFLGNRTEWYDIPYQAETKSDIYAEYLLGDALLWACDCAMFQPVNLGLADALRRNFHSYLPYECIERLYKLPETNYAISGLRFSDDILKILRSGFITRRDENEQEDVLRFILEEIQKVEPSEKDGLGYLAWESVKERLRLELEPTYDMIRLSKLAKTPLRDSISSELEYYGFIGEKDIIPFRNRHKLFRDIERVFGQVDEGYIYGFNLLSFLHLVNIEDKTITLRITSKSRVGFLHFENGELIDAEAEDRLKGEDAALEIICWDEPKIEIQGIQEEKRRRTINSSLMQILLKSSQRKDYKNESSPVGEGYIYGFNLLSFLHLVNIEDKTITLRITSKSRVGLLHLENGELIDAEAKAFGYPLKGEAATLEILCWDDTKIEIQAIQKKKRSINSSLMAILLEASRRKDNEGDSPHFWEEQLQEAVKLAEGHHFKEAKQTYIHKLLANLTKMNAVNYTIKIIQTFALSPKMNTFPDCLGFC